MLILSDTLTTLRRPASLQKAIRTGLSGAPGLVWWSVTGDVLGVAFAPAQWWRTRATAAVN